MVYPTLRDWLFSVKTFAAAMLALYIGLAFELPRPYWAMATVYIVSNPFVGATRSKAIYRALGTVLGASGAVLLVPPFVESPYLFSVIVATWTGTMLYLAVSDRTARSYVFMLAAYTMPIIALPSVTNPTGVFDLAVSRTLEIIVGIVCASIVGSAGVSEPARADDHRAHRRMVSRRRVLRDRNAIRPYRKLGDFRRAATAREHDQRPRTAAEPARLRSHAARRARARA
ncbi:putative membrane protein YccC [Paraburkholderia atlantica]|uniref:FUSC family protein n=1 Tax=Paraburkholderia atlantica TaxID=2654982 RepID=UPI003D211CEF